MEHLLCEMLCKKKKKKKSTCKILLKGSCSEHSLEDSVLLIY